jgi:hypothetical protein
MKRTLTSRGLAVVFVCAAVSGLLVGPASAARSRLAPRTAVVASGTWTDPGPTITSVTPEGDKYLIDFTGSTTSSGDFTGTSAYTMSLLWDPATNDSRGSERETWSATLAGYGSGHLTLAERDEVNGDGSLLVTGRIIGGDGVFRGAVGFAAWTGTTDPSGSSPSSGTYQMLIVLAGS